MPTVPNSRFLIDPNWTVFAAPVQTILQVAEQLGANRQQLLSDAGLDASELKIPDRRFPISSYFRLFQLAASAADDPDIGLKVGRVTALKGLNLQLYMATVCQSFRDYLNLLPNLLELRGDIGKVTAHRDADLVELRWEPLLVETGRKRFISDEILGAAANIINSLCAMPVPVVKAQFSYAQPQDVSALEDTFGRNLTFGKQYSSLFFKSVALDFPLLKQDTMAGQIRVIRSVIFLLVMILQTSCWQVSSNRLFSTCPRVGQPLISWLVSLISLDAHCSVVYRIVILIF